MAVSGLYTTVKNVSGAARVFGFLGAHGKRLANNETYTVPGDLVAAVGKGGRGGQRQFKALERALADGTLIVTSSPAVYLTDTQDGSHDQIKLTNNALGTVTPPTGWDS
ncbi:hypothetical protein EBZ39_05905 [bacterium]|nr:hypothetical protein [bacterium]